MVAPCLKGMHCIEDLFIYLLKIISISTICFELPGRATKRRAAVAYADPVTNWAARHKETDVLEIVVTESVLSIHLLIFPWIVRPQEGGIHVAFYKSGVNKPPACTPQGILLFQNSYQLPF